MPITELPFGGSWGYQPLGMFAPSARYGTPAEFATFVDACHRAGLALILDWVPAHFPSDPHGLAWFDGTALYEHADPRQSLHPDWRSEEHTSELQSLMRISYAVFCLKKKNHQINII